MNLLGTVGNRLALSWYTVLFTTVFASALGCSSKSTSTASGIFVTGPAVSTYGKSFTLDWSWRTTMTVKLRGNEGRLLWASAQPMTRGLVKFDIEGGDLVITNLLAEGQEDRVARLEGLELAEMQVDVVPMGSDNSLSGFRIDIRTDTDEFEYKIDVEEGS